MQDALTRIPKVDQQFSELCPRLSDEEYANLEDSLKREGCRESLIIWPDCPGCKNALLDGHHRLEICGAKDIVYTLKEKHFASREEAVNWIINNQLGRRNLTPEQASYLRGKRYAIKTADANERRRVSQVGKAVSERGRQNDENDTRHVLAAEFAVSASTIERDHKFAKAVDKISKNVGKEAKQQILSGKLPVTKSQVVDLAAMPATKQREALGDTDKLRDTLRKNRSSKLRRSKLPPPDYITAAEEIDVKLTSLIGRVIAAGFSEAANQFKTARGLIRSAVASLRRKHDVMAFSRTAQNGRDHSGARAKNG